MYFLHFPNMRQLGKRAAGGMKGFGPNTSIQVVVALTSSIHEFLFVYSCMRQARPCLDESFAPEVLNLTAAAGVREHCRPVGTNMAPLRSWMGVNMPINSEVSCPTGADMLKSGLTLEQKNAIRAILNKPLAVVNCLAGSGKTRKLTEVIRLRTQSVAKEDYIMVAVPNKTMAHRLCTILQHAVSGSQTIKPLIVERLHNCGPKNGWPSKICVLGRSSS